jgi:hypothetical protein
VWFQTLPLLSIPSANQKVRRRIVIYPADSCIKGNPPHCRVEPAVGMASGTARTVTLLVRSTRRLNDLIREQLLRRSLEEYLLSAAVTY